ncbi:thioredoxin-related transmembrane protein 2 homolog isoform X2 [Belonocnema kinseyi]|uniref:thioredoxin-related transmembrane protein 2 homolog isoform X2 n=1 Tax=Belonocnema kinseyi TaxID=2817044 RepID=UPI00143D63EE|nr:thioredoxin-related transmembrane protein 2 homolog isoform X2 [Belonocnema kinseyi]
MSLKKDLMLLRKPYYLVNILLSLTYVISKRIPMVCHMLGQAECELDSRETEILFFLMIVIMIRTRKAGSVTMINYLSSSFVYTKVTNLILWFYADIRMVCGLLLPEPTYQGPEKVIYLRGATSLQEEFQRDIKVTWLVAFYTAWNPACVTFAPIFSQLSVEFALDNFKFGKVDVGRHPDAAAKYHICDASTSKQLPTLILFKEGKEVDRRPYADNKGKLVKFLFSIDNVKAAFDLNNVYQNCRTDLAKKKDKKQLKQE